MRGFFFLLLLANVVVLLVTQAARDRGTEPERLAMQVNTSRLTVIDATGRSATAPSAAISKGPTSNDGATSCVEIGDFNAQTAASFEQDLSRLSLNHTPQRRVVQAAPSQLVYLPPQGSEAEANRRLAQLREKGFTDSAVIRDDAARRWGISLGRFTRSELADAHLEKLRSAGVTDARIVEYPANSTRYAYRVSGVTTAGSTRLAAAAANYSGVTLRRCP